MIIYYCFRDGLLQKYRQFETFFSEEIYKKVYLNKLDHLTSYTIFVNQLFKDDQRCYSILYH